MFESLLTLMATISGTVLNGTDPVENARVSLVPQKPTVSFIAGNRVESPNPVRQWTGAPLGTPSPSRIIVALITSHTWQTANPIVSVTIGGEEATIELQIGFDTTASPVTRHVVAWAHVPEGATGDVRIELDQDIATSNGVSSAIALYEIHGGALIATTSNVFTGNISTPITVNGFRPEAVLAMYNSAPNVSLTWTGATQDYTIGIRNGGLSTVSVVAMATATMDKNKYGEVTVTPSSATHRNQILTLVSIIPIPTRETLTNEYGEYEFDDVLPYEDYYHVACEYDDGVEKFNTVSKPFITGS